jgi:hypothetical protein
MEGMEDVKPNGSHLRRWTADNRTTLPLRLTAFIALPRVFYRFVDRQIQGSYIPSTSICDSQFVESIAT